METQQAYNDEHGITPTTIRKAVRDQISILADVQTPQAAKLEKDPESMDEKELKALISKLKQSMNTAAAELNFEEAAVLRDRMIEMKKLLESR